MDLDLRKLRYFVAVADKLHFGRAADELHIAQPALSRQIRALEHDLGTPLLTRDSHGVALTDAGRQLLTDAGPLLASARAVRRRVTVAAGGSQRLMVGFRAGIAVTPAVRLFAEQHPDVIVDVQRIEWDDQAPMLLDGRIDVGYVRLPIDEAGLRVTPLYTEPRVAVLPAGHRLAGADAVRLADLRDDGFVTYPADRGAALYEETLRLCHEAGFDPAIVQEASEISTIIGIVAAGLGVAVVPDSVSAIASSGVAYRPLEPRAELERWAVWRDRAPLGVVHAFVTSLSFDEEQSPRSSR